MSIEFNCEARVLAAENLVLALLSTLYSTGELTDEQLKDLFAKAITRAAAAGGELGGDASLHLRRLFVDAGVAD